MAILSIQRNLLSITLAMSTFGFANGLVGVFIPLIMLENGMGISQVCAFYVIYALVKITVNPFAIRITQRFGPHVGLGAGFVGAASQFGFLGVFTSHPHPSTWLAFCGGAALAITNAAIWNSLHIHISRAMDNATKSSSLATMDIINQVLGVIAPLLGGAIGAWLGPGWLLVIAIVTTLLAACSSAPCW